MTVNLRRRAYGRPWGMGQTGSGETETEGTALPTESTPDFNTVTYSSGEVAIDTLPAPGFNLPTAPAPELSPTELAAEQQRARDWLAQLPNVVSTAGKVVLSASQIAAGVTAGQVKPSSTCPGGYMMAGGQCVTAAPTPQGLIPGVSNTTLALIGGGFLFLMLLSGGGRRR